MLTSTRILTSITPLTEIVTRGNSQRVVKVIGSMMRATGEEYLTGIRRVRRSTTKEVQVKRFGHGRLTAVVLIKAVRRSSRAEGPPVELGNKLPGRGLLALGSRHPNRNLLDLVNKPLSREPVEQASRRPNRGPVELGNKPPSTGPLALGNRRLNTEQVEPVNKLLGRRLVGLDRPGSNAGTTPFRALEMVSKRRTTAIGAARAAVVDLPGAELVPDLPAAGPVVEDPAVAEPVAVEANDKNGIK